VEANLYTSYLHFYVNGKKLTKARLPAREYRKAVARIQVAVHACQEPLGEVLASLSRKAENQYSAGHEARNLVETCRSQKQGNIPMLSLHHLSRRHSFPRQAKAQANQGTNRAAVDSHCWY